MFRDRVWVFIYDDDKCLRQLWFIEQSGFKGTVSRDFLLLVFFHESVPQPQSIPLRPFRIFSNTGGKIAAGINDTGGKFFHHFC